MESSLKELTDFLTFAHQNTYANKAVPEVAPSRPGSHDYHFEKDFFAYHDTYFDVNGRDFIGNEIVYENNIPVWGMNYCGAIVLNTADMKETFNFLRDALRQISWPDLPVRGPQSYTKGSLSYAMGELEGSLSRFRAREYIYDQKNTLWFECFLHGGLIH